MAGNRAAVRGARPGWERPLSRVIAVSLGLYSVQPGAPLRARNEVLGALVAAMASAIAVCDVPVGVIVAVVSAYKTNSYTLPHLPEP